MTDLRLTFAIFEMSQKPIGQMILSTDERIEDESRRQSYGSNLLVSSSITRPNVEQILTGISMLLSSMIDTSSSTGRQNDGDVFSSAIPDSKVSAIDIKRILQAFHTKGKSSEECLIIALVLINRVLGFGEIQLNSYNWKHIVLSCLLIAHKSWDDYALKSLDFVYLWSRIIRTEINPTLAELNRMEIKILTMIDFNVFVTPR